MDQPKLTKWWNSTVLPALQEKVDELVAKGATAREANDAIVQVMLVAVRRRHQKFFDGINQSRRS